MNPWPCDPTPWHELGDDDKPSLIRVNGLRREIELYAPAADPALVTSVAAMDPEMTPEEMKRAARTSKRWSEALVRAAPAPTP